MSQSCSTDQLNTLLDFLNEHRDLARGLLRTSDGRARAKRLWEELTQLLNSLGGSVKKVQQWQKVWTDRKHMAKKNAAALRRSQTGTGGGPSSACLSQWELRVLDIMGEGFGGPQTTARVPAFPTINLNQEVAQYNLQQLSPPTVGNIAEIVLTEEIPRLLPEPLASPPMPPSPAPVEPQQQTSASSRLNNRSSRRLTRRPIPGSNISERLLQLEKDKMILLNNINSRLLGIEKAILELVKLRQDNN